MSDVENKNSSKTALIIVPVIVALIGCFGLIASTAINKIQLPIVPTSTPTQLPANNVIIKFVVLDKTSQKNISGAKITLQIGIMPSESDITDIDGVARFFLNSENVGLHGFLQVEADGYKFQKRDIDINEKEPIEIYLEPEKPISSQTPTATLVSTPTKTSIPFTPTISAPYKASEYLNNLNVISLIAFDNSFDINEWYFNSDSGEVNYGSLEIIGGKTDGTTHGIANMNTFSEYQGCIVNFSYTGNSEFNMVITSGTWNTDERRQFELRIVNNQISLAGWEGTRQMKELETERLSGNLLLRPDKFYQYMVAILPNGEILTVVWDWEDTSKAIVYRKKFGENWSKLDWKFELTAIRGTMLIDNYKEIEFDSIK